MSKLEVLELMHSVLHCNYSTRDGIKLLDYKEVMDTIDFEIQKEKSKPSYFDCTLEEHQEALYG